MNKIIILIFTILPLCSTSQTRKVQHSSDSLYAFRNDSLFISPDSIITIGQKLKIGNGSDENGWYESIGFKSAFAWPLWLFRNSELENVYDKPDGAYIREREKVKSYLSPGEDLVVIKIKKKGNRRRGFAYIVYLRNRSFPGLNFFCNIKLGLETKEILLP